MSKINKISELSEHIFDSIKDTTLVYVAAEQKNKVRRYYSYFSEDQDVQINKVNAFASKEECEIYCKKLELQHGAGRKFLTFEMSFESLVKTFTHLSKQKDSDTIHLVEIWLCNVDMDHKIKLTELIYKSLSN